MAALTRINKLELFRDLGYEPHPGQLRVHRSKARHRVLACGTRWGKSTLGANETIAELLEPRDQAIGWLVAPTYDLTRRIFDRVTTALHQHLAHRIERYSPREHEIVIANLGGGRSTLRAKSADNRVGLLGEALDFLVIDEAAQLPTAIWDEHLSPRLIDRSGRSLVLSTPLPGGGWFYEAWKRGRKNRDPETESWRAPSWENPHLKRATIEAERARLPADTFSQQYEAKFQGVPREPCESCGGPQPDADYRIRLPDGQEPEDLPVCADCGFFVDSSGRCIVKYNNEWSSSLQVEWSKTMAVYSWHALDANGRWF